MCIYKPALGHDHHSLKVLFTSPTKLWYNEINMPKMSRQGENNLRDIGDVCNNGIRYLLSLVLIQAIPSPALASDHPSAPHQQMGIGILVWVVQLLQGPGGLLPFAGDILIWAAGTALLISLLAVLLFAIRRRQRRVPVPRPTSNVPSIESPDGEIYFRLDDLNEDGLIIGRGKHGVDLRIDEAVPHADTVSNRHARIYYDSTYGHVVIEDLGSTNGVFINGRQAPRKNLLRDGWSIGLGQLTLTYHDGESDTGPLD